MIFDGYVHGRLSKREFMSMAGRYAAAGVTGSAWLLVAGLAAHGLKDLWQHRT